MRETEVIDSWNRTNYSAVSIIYWVYVNGLQKILHFSGILTNFEQILNNLLWNIQNLGDAEVNNGVAIRSILVVFPSSILGLC